MTTTHHPTIERPPDTKAPTRHSHQSFKPLTYFWKRSMVRRLLITALLVGVLAVEPTLAQPVNPVCGEDSGQLVTMIEGFIQLTLAIGLLGLLVVWQADELASMFTMNQRQTQALEQHKRNALKSGLILTLLGPLFTIAGNVMGLPIAHCVNLIPL